MRKRSPDSSLRDRQVRRDLYLEGAANLVVLVAKAFVGISTGSLAVVGDALHSLTDVANNVGALIVMRHATAPPDPGHPYGHRKFEALAVFVLATLLSVLAVELLLRGLGGGTREIVHADWGLVVMGGVLVANIGISTWQALEARRLDSEILRADARHTFADVLTTIAVILGWQFAAHGYPWVDTVAACAVAALVLALALGLYRRTIPILVDAAAVDADALKDAVGALPGVLETRRVRSHHAGSHVAVDITVSVAPDLPTTEAHAIADAIEQLVAREFGGEDVTVHVEPHHVAP
jgi:cation diffusion facilitator family transporter